METKDDYISRKELLRNWPLCDEPGDAYQYVRGFPAADVQPAVHGEWIKRLEQVGPVKIAVPVCSTCKAIVPVDVSRYKYCPNCGAGMRKKEET